jgi:chromosome segregation ATPase
METDARPPGRIVSQMVQGLEDNNQRLVEDNINLRQELERMTAEISTLHKAVTDVEAERDDWIKECATERSKRDGVRDLTHEQAKAEYEQKYQVLDIHLSAMDHDTWFSIIASRENTYQSRVQKLQLEIERLAAVNRQCETEMAVLRSFCMAFLSALSPD